MAKTHSGPKASVYYFYGVGNFTSDVRKNVTVAWLIANIPDVALLLLLMTAWPAERMLLRNLAMASCIGWAASATWLGGDGPRAWPGWRCWLSRSMCSVAAHVAGGFSQRCAVMRDISFL